MPKFTRKTRLYIAQEGKKCGDRWNKQNKKTCAYPDLKMVRNCCVTACKSNYLSEKEKVTVYWLQSDPEEWQRWIKATSSDNIPDGPDTAVLSNIFH